MDTIKTVQEIKKMETPRFVMPIKETARMERRRNSRLRNLMDQLDHANANQNAAKTPDKAGMSGLNRNAMLTKTDLLLLQSVNDGDIPAADRRQTGERKPASAAGDDLPLFNPLKKDISI